MRKILFLLISFLTCSLFANDGASTAPAGGLVLRKEERISIKKEILTIRIYDVNAEYEFENLTDQDVKTYVQFPLPRQAVNDSVNDPSVPLAIEKHFELWVDDKSKTYQTEIKVFSPNDPNKDHKAVLDRLRISPINSEQATQRMGKLSAKNKKELRDLGLVSVDAGVYTPDWFVQKIFYWEQVFPAKKILRVKHRYWPQTGATSAQYVLQEACVDEPTKKAISQLDQRRLFATWLDYVLTTANTWSGPIRDFKLIVKKERDISPDKFIISTCFPGLKKVDERTFEAHFTDFKPDKELRIYFFK